MPYYTVIWLYVAAFIPNASKSLGSVSLLLQSVLELCLTLPQPCRVLRLPSSAERTSYWRHPWYSWPHQGSLLNEEQYYHAGPFHRQLTCFVFICINSSWSRDETSFLTSWEGPLTLGLQLCSFSYALCCCPLQDFSLCCKAGQLHRAKQSLPPGTGGKYRFEHCFCSCWKEIGLQTPSKLSAFFSKSHHPIDVAAMSITVPKSHCGSHSKLAGVLASSSSSLS